jgi:hypothetical protein
MINREQGSCYDLECINGVEKLSNSLYHLYIRKLGKKRTFKEIEMDQISQENLEKNFSTVGLSKRYKLNKNDHYIQIESQVPVKQSNDFISSEIASQDNSADELVSISTFDMEKEKKIVEEYYSQKNQQLLHMMFGHHH